MGRHESTLQWGVQHSETRLLPSGKGSVIVTVVLPRTDEAARRVVIESTAGQADHPSEVELYAEREERFCYDSLVRVGSVQSISAAHCNLSEETESAT
jgi:hypothetical protein